MRVNYPIVEGIYEHYKGGIYVVLTLAQDTATDKPVVVYQSTLFGSIYTRPLDEFMEEVTLEDRTKVRRFKLDSYA